jgi:superfamily I DNA and/or RNA helicase
MADETLNYLQERKIIIISTVRSSQEYLSYDLRHTLGFVANRRRFNGQAFLPFSSK